MAGLAVFAPIYLNGLLALLFIFVFPGLILVRAFRISGFPQRWLTVFLTSLTSNHLLVTLIATLHLDPLETYRVVVAALATTLVCVAMAARRKSMQAGSSIVYASDIKWMLGTLAVLCFVYFSVWKHGVPNIFQGSDVSASWNAWSLIWSQGKFPTASYGYPQLIPTTWAVTYIFTGSQEQYFAFYSYIVFLIVPIVLCATVLAQTNWRHALLLIVVFAWFVAEIREPWLKATLEQGFPDWVAAIFAFCGTMLFVANAQEGEFDNEKVVSALISLCMVSIAAATKPLYGLFAIAILIGVCADAAKYLPHQRRSRVIGAAVGLISIFIAVYAVNYAHLTVRSLPSYPVPELSERLSRAFRLLNSNFTLPFRILALIGILLSPFLSRVRYQALPLFIGFALWANTASYDLRNVLGLLLISAFIPLYALSRAFVIARSSSNERRWVVPDGAVAIRLVILSVGLTLTLAQSDKELKQRFADEQLQKGFGFELNKNIEKLLLHGCTIFSADPYIYTVSAFQPFLGQLRFFHFNLPLNDLLANQFNESTGCTSIFFPPDTTHQSIVSFVDAYTKARGFVKVAEGRGMELLVSSP